MSSETSRNLVHVALVFHFVICRVFG